jgi:hypothetical protein
MASRHHSRLDMMKPLRAAAALLALILMHADGTAAQTPPASGAVAQGDAYADATARETVRRARERRALVDRSIEAYEATATERISAGHRLLLRERLLYRRESAARVNWQREGPIEVEVLGVREVIPVAVELPQIPGDLDAYMGSMAFDPMNAQFLLRFSDTDLRNPLADGSEEDYRFATGDSTTLVLPGGRRVRLRELRIQPRRRHPSLIAGSYWFDTDSYAVVQAVFRLARPWTMADADDDDMPGFLGGISADISHVAVEYGLWEQRWWLPRFVTAAGVVKLGMFGSVPIEFERRYERYLVRGDTTMLPEVRDSTTRERCRRNVAFTIGVGVQDSARLARAQTRSDRRRVAYDSAVAVYDSLVAAGESPDDPPCQPFLVTIPDSVDLIASPWLPADIHAGETLMAERELRDLMERVENLPEMDWGVARPQLQWGLGGSGLVRYNRVEALAVGARVGVDLGKAQAAAVARYGVADEKLSGELSFARESATHSWRLSGYHQLAAMDPATDPFSLASSLNALLIGRDDAQYYRAAGAALAMAPAAVRNQWWEARLYGERQMAVSRNTDFSLRHVLDGDADFRPVVPAERADQAGLELTLRGQHGTDPNGLRLGAELSARGEVGDFDFGRERLTLRAAFPLPLGFAGALEAAGGTADGDVPRQSHWYLGGPTTLRGYPTATLAGPSFWRGRAELGRGPPGLRISVFGDAGWAGERQDLRSGRPLLSAGVGGSFLDGILRFDVARALRSPTGWRVHLYMDGLL